MGEHYIPKYYLRGFTQESTDLICVYDKKEGGHFLTQIKNVANETGLYPPETEKYLANCIEGPANSVLNKIRQRKQITGTDKKILGEYMAVMWKRIPQAQQRLKDMAPKLSQEVFEDIQGTINILSAQTPSKAEFLKRREEEIRQILERYAKDPPKEIWLKTIRPDLTPGVVAAIQTMTWIFLTCDEKAAFLTCDNPVFYFTSIGIGKPESELSFPISSHIMLWATWRRDLPEGGYVRVSSQVIKEMTRRIVIMRSDMFFTVVTSNG
ncbi:MAG: DUF4238 domain-containing protein [Proteobacteria bacterium]|nr:DUF4238 domain-containing protein [Pseudomonadota bacterium]